MNEIAEKPKRLVLVGTSAFAEVALEYFSRESDYDVVGFAVERDYLNQTEMASLPVVALEELDEIFSPADHHVFVAIAYAQLNRLRTRLCEVVKDKGYPLASFISPNAMVSPSANVGEHCFIFENNVIQPRVTIGNNVILWSGNHIGHHTRVGNNCFVSSHVVISGYCDVGENCFLGVNSTIPDGISISADCWIGPGVVISADTDAGQLFPATKPTASRADTLRFFKVGH